MKEVMKIVLTNWINVASIFIAVYVAGFISAVVKDKFKFNEALFGTTYSILGYGMIFWIGFFILISLLDILLFSFNRQQQYTNYKLAFEWLLISSPFIYWLIKYNQWIFLVAIIAFLIGQFLRKPHIFKILLP
jgi:hypothetical protein